MFCRNCGKELIGSPETCPNCGARPVTGNSFCSNCGAPTTPLTEMCPKCGAQVAGKAKAGRKWPIIVGIVLLIVLIPLGIFTAVVAFNVAGFLGAGTEETAKTEMAGVQTALNAGMANISCGQLSSTGSIGPADYTKLISCGNGNFSLEQFLKLPTHGNWTWDNSGVITGGTYQGGGKTCTYTANATPQWDCH